MALANTITLRPDAPRTRPATELVETALLNGSGKRIGHIDELLIDLQSGRVRWVIGRTDERPLRRFRIAWQDLHWDRNSCGFKVGQGALADP